MSDFEKWCKVININLLGTLYVTRQFLMQMAEKKSGAIINIASISGLMGVPGQTNYATAKGGIISFTKSLAKEAARLGITVNAIAPGYVDTDMIQGYPEKVKQQFLSRIPLNRFAQPNEIGYLATFLASAEASYITGQVIAIDGGII